MSAMEHYVSPAQPVPQTERLTVDQLRYISGTDLIPRAYRGNLPAMMACVLTGRALGLDDLHSLRSIHVVDGKATLGAELMVSLVRRKGHSLSGEMSNEAATARGKRADTGDEMSVTWTLEDAQRAGLSGKGNWTKYPGSMLWARAVSQLVRMLFPDALLGVTYTPDEMGDDHMVIDVPAVDSDGSVLEDGRPALDGPGEPFEGVQSSGAREAPEGVAPDTALEGDIGRGGVDPDGGIAAASTHGPPSSTDAGADPPTTPPVAAPAHTLGEEADAPGSDDEPAPVEPLTASASPNDKVISDAQRRRLHAIRNKAGVSEQRCKLIVEALTGQDSTAGILTSQYDTVIQAIEADAGGDEQATVFPIPETVQEQLAHRDPIDRV